MKSRLLGAVCAGVFILITVSANAAFIGRLPTTPGSTDYQAYYDDQLNITWTANANINGQAYHANQNNWAAGLVINGIGGWRLPFMNAENTLVVYCESVTQEECKVNEMGHLYYYGAGTTFGDGITPDSSGPFSNVQAYAYWGEVKPGAHTFSNWFFSFSNGYQSWTGEDGYIFAWAVHDGDIGAVPIPPALYLFGSGLIGLVGVAKQKATKCTVDKNSI